MADRPDRWQIADDLYIEFVDIGVLREQDLNAQVMQPRHFERLTENIRQRGMVAGIRGSGGRLRRSVGRGCCARLNSGGCGTRVNPRRGGFGGILFAASANERADEHGNANKPRSAQTGGWMHLKIPSISSDLADGPDCTSTGWATG